VAVIPPVDKGGSGEFTEVQLGCGEVSARRFLGGVECAEMNPPADTHNLSLVSTSALVETDTLKTAGVVFSLSAVLPVLRVIRLPKIRPTIIRPVAIAMIYFEGWPFTRDDQPDHPMRYVALAEDRQLPIAV
jgi:hypothetical protein